MHASEKIFLELAAKVPLTGSNGWPILPPTPTNERPRANARGTEAHTSLPFTTSSSAFLQFRAVVVVQRDVCTKQSLPKQTLGATWLGRRRVEATLRRTTTLAAVSAARKLAPRYDTLPVAVRGPTHLGRRPPGRKRHCVQSLPERFRVLCPPGTWAFLGAFLCAAEAADCRHDGTELSARDRDGSGQSTACHSTLIFWPIADRRAVSRYSHPRCRDRRASRYNPPLRLTHLRTSRKTVR